MMDNPSSLTPYKGALSVEEVVDGMNLAAKNAVRLAEDAIILLNQDRYPSACALAILSIEESGKISILRRMALCDCDGDAAKVWKEYRSHKSKNTMWTIVEYFLNGADKLYDFNEMFLNKENSILLDNLKQISIYTDRFGKKKWSFPEENIDEKVASSIVNIARILSSYKEVSVREVELWIKHFKPVQNRGVASNEKALENWYEAMQREGLEPEGINEMRVFIRKGFRHIVPEKNKL